MTENVRLEQIQRAQTMWADSILKVGTAWGEKRGYGREAGIVAFLELLAKGFFFAHYDPKIDDMVWELGKKMTPPSDGAESQGPMNGD